MKIIKEPEFEDDSYYFILEKHDRLRPENVSYSDSYRDIILRNKSDDYLQTKRSAFRDINISTDAMTGFLDRPSFRDHKKQYNLVGTIYTASAWLKNEMPYSLMMEKIRENKDTSRRCSVRLADPFADYMDDKVNTSCLNLIHYFQDTVKFIFRASDMTYELFYDLHLLKEFFVDPVFGEQPVEMHIISCTAQNIVNPQIFIK